MYNSAEMLNVLKEIAEVRYAVHAVNADENRAELFLVLKDKAYKYPIWDRFYAAGCRTISLDVHAAGNEGAVAAIARLIGLQRTQGFVYGVYGVASEALLAQAAAAANLQQAVSREEAARKTAEAVRASLELAERDAAELRGRLEAAHAKLAGPSQNDELLRRLVAAEANVERMARGKLDAERATEALRRELYAEKTACMALRERATALQAELQAAARDRDDALLTRRDFDAALAQTLAQTREVVRAAADAHADDLAAQTTAIVGAVGTAEAERARLRADRQAAERLVLRRRKAPPRHAEEQRLEQALRAAQLRCDQDAIQLTVRQGRVLNLFAAIYFGLAPQVQGIDVTLYDDRADVHDRHFRTALNAFALHRLGEANLFPSQERVRYVIEAHGIAGMTLRPLFNTWQFVRADVARTLDLAAA